MLQCQYGCVLVVEDDICDPFYLPVSRYGHHWKGYRTRDTGIDRDESFYTSGRQDVQILLQPFLYVTVGHGHEQVFMLPQRGFDSADHHATVGVSYFLGDHPHHKSALVDQT